jgi:DNA-binding MarR family transcriptional regulator
MAMSARETAELLLQVGRLVQAEGYGGELSPAQWMALRFFARANPFSRTPSAFAEFQATTRGTATQAIKALEAGGYLVRHPFKMDGRSVSLRLTSKGKKALAHDPFEVLVRAVDSLAGGLGFTSSTTTTRSSRCDGTTEPSGGPRFFRR